MSKPKNKLSGRVIGRVLGVPFTATRESLGFIVGRLVIGIVLALIFWQEHPLNSQLSIGLRYSVLIILSLWGHILGHLVVGKGLGAPMDENFITPKLIETRYHENPTDIAPLVHVLRTSAGIAATLIIALLSAVLWRLTASHWWLLLTLFNLVLGVIVTLPFKGVDGAVLWREMVLKHQKNLD